MREKSGIGRWLKLIVSEAAVVAALYFLVRHLVNNWGQIAPSLRNMRLGYVVAAFVPILVMLLTVSWGWTLAVRWVGSSLGGRAGFAIYYRSSIFRYLPGSFWYLPGRAYLCRERGISLKAFASSAFVELFFLLAAAGVLGGYAVAVRFELVWLLGVSLVCLLSVVLALLWPGQLRRLVVRGNNLESDRSNAREGALRASLSVIVFVYLCSWLMYGVSLELLLLALDVPAAKSTGNAVYVVSASVTAWMAGFLSLIPTGLGIREAALAGMFCSIAPAEHVIVASLVQRTIEILLEGCLWMVSLWLGGREMKIIPK